MVDTTSGKTLKFNMIAQNSSAPTKKVKTLIQSINNDQWNRLTHGSVFKITGWSDNAIFRGTGALGANNLEILDIQPITTQPQINTVRLIQGGVVVTNINKTMPLQVEINGTNLFAHLATNTSMKLTFVSSSGNKDFTMNFAESAETLNNEATQAIFELTPSELSALTAGSSYKIRVNGANGTSGEVGPSSGFTIASNIGSGGLTAGYSVVGDYVVRSSIVMGSPVETVDNITIYLGPQSSVSKGDVIAVDLTGTPLATVPDKSTLRLKIANQTTLVNGVNIPLLAVVDELLLFGIPSGLDQGLYRLIIETAGGNGISIVDAIQLLGEPPSNNPSSPSFTVWSANVFNVSDRARLILDDNAVLADVSEGGGAAFSMTHNITGTHKIHLEAYNNDSGTGTSWGFEIKANGKVVYKDVRGSSENRTNANELVIFPFSALLGNGPFGTGIVFSQDLIVKQNQSSFGSLNSYTAKLFNVSDDMEMLVNGVPFMAAQDNGTGQVQSSGQFNHRLQSGIGNEVRFRVRKGPQGQQFTGKHFTYGMEVHYGNQLIYHYLDGQRDLVNERSAGAKWHEEALLGQPLLDETFLVFQ